MAHDPLQPAGSIQPASQVDHKPVRRVSRRGPTSPITDRPLKPAEFKLRLVGSAAPDTKPPTTNPTPIASPTDPRWVLAVSTAQLMESDVLPPHKREVLMAQGKSMGLSPFDCSLILAIIQDRARRGITLDQCPAQSATQLALIPLPTMRSFRSVLGEHPARTLMFASGLLALQVLLVWIWLS